VMHSLCYSRSWMVALAVALLLVSGCQKKKPQVPAAQTQAPTITEPTAQQPQAAPAPAPETTPTTEPPVETTPTPAPETKAQKPSPIKRRKPANGQNQPAGQASAKKTPPTTPPPANTTIAKASPPPAPEGVGQISPDMSQSAASQAQQSTTQLLDSAERNLRNLNRTLSSDELNIVSQIRSYINQAKSALKDQDLERAHNLAAKARQLSEGLLHP